MSPCHLQPYLFQLLMLPIWYYWLESGWVDLCQFQVCAGFLTTQGLNYGMWALDRKWVIPFQVWQLCPFLLSSLQIWSHWIDRKWVISCHIQLWPFSQSSLPIWPWWFDRKWISPSKSSCVLSHCTQSKSGFVGLTGSEWFHTISSCGSSHYHHLQSDPVHMTACEWFHDRFHCVPSDFTQFQFDPVGLIASEWFHARSSCVPSYFSHFQSDPLGWTGSKWLHARFNCLFSLCSLWIWVCGLNSLWVIPCHVQLCPLTVFTPNLVLLAW